MARKIQVIAHRGAHENQPQNSLAAYQAAIDLGCDYIETDLRTSSRGQLLIKHDALSEGESLPTFDDVLSLAKGRIRIYLDVKQALPAAIVGAVEQHGMRDSILTYGGFQLLRDLVQLRPGWPCMPEAVNESLLKQSLADLKPRAIAFSGGDFKPELVQLALAAGCDAFLDRQGKTDNPEDWEKAIQAGVTGIQTDRPSALLAWLRTNHLHP
ncbi:MAG: glycerophosphodiester phosphodiesterase family protein [Acidobacteria bacterium]|nr:glycerophosphodiester phosphodiesterase family protein [Acidobacteriota bacterium]